MVNEIKPVLASSAMGLSEVAEKVSAICKKRNTKKLEALLSRSDAVFLDEPYIDALKYVASMEPAEGGQRLFSKLMTKNFSAFSLRRLLEKKLTVDEAVKISSLSVDSLASYSTSTGLEFENALNLCILIFDSQFQKFVWHKDHCDSINDLQSLLKKLIEICSQFTNIESVAKVRTELPGLFAPPRSDYFLEKIEMETVQF